MFGYLCHLAGMDNTAYPWSNGEKSSVDSPRQTKRENLNRKPRIKKVSESSDSQGGEILQLAETMKDWDAEKVKAFFEGIRESYSKKPE